MKIHYNGTTSHYILYSVSDLIGNHLSMVESINWQGNNSKNKSCLREGNNQDNEIEQAYYRRAPILDNNSRVPR